MTSVFRVIIFSCLGIAFSLWLDLKDIEREFKDDVTNVSREFTQRIASIDSTLISYATLLDVSESINETELSAYSEQIIKTYPYIDAIIDMDHVDQEGVSGFEQMMNQRGFINLKIRSNNTVNKSQNNQYFPISSIEPMTPAHARLLGLNLYSSDYYFDDIERAIRSGNVIASKINSLLLMDETEILLFKALYSGRYEPKNESDRISSVIGIVALEVDVEKFMAFTQFNDKKLLGGLENFSIISGQKEQGEGFDSSFEGIEYIKVIKKYGQLYQLHLSREFETSLINKERMLAIWLTTMALAFFVLFLFDKRRIAEKALQSSEKRFIRIAHATPIGIFQTDVNGFSIFVNDSYLNLLQLTEPDVLKLGWIDYIYPEDKKMVTNSWALAIKKGQNFMMDYRMIMPDGHFIWVHCESAAEFDEQGQVLSFFGTIQNITEQKEASEKISYQAHFDSLTGLPNRFLSLDRLSHMLSEAQRYEDKVALLFIDLDEFKKVNDSLGHEVGDSLLKEAASRLEDVIRSGDTVGRLGGDEFLMIIGGLTNSLEVNLVTEKIIESFRQPFELNGHELYITASIGIALYPEDSQTASELLRNADLAMYQAKEFGKNTFSFYTEKLNKENSRRLLIEEKMRNAFERNEFSVVYQPKIKMSNGNIMGAEALVRWHNEDIGQISPEEFIPIAEQSDMIHKIGKFVLKNALNETASWQKQFNSKFKIAVNLSPQQFRNKNLISLVTDTLNETNVASSCLELEITEGVLLNKFSGIEELLNSLSSLGVQLAMDDFGTGYSSLSYLRSFPFNVLKVDRSFVRDMTEDTADCELVYATIAMSHGLNLKVVAEGVETKEQYKLLKQHHCDYAQGYLMSKPISAESMSILLSQNKIYDI